MLIRTFVLGGAEFGARLEWVLDLPDLVVTRSEFDDNLSARLADENVDLIILDAQAAQRSLYRTVVAMRALPDRPDVVVVTPAEDPRQRAELLAEGCAAVLFFALPDAVLARTLASLVTRLRQARAGHPPPLAPSGEPSLGDFVSNSAAMRALIATAGRVADADAALLILGETGVGKERLARAVHAAGARKDGPFIAVNCGAIPEALLESEFFGHEKGAFTSAMRARRGHFELAHGGTIFLDEIGDLPMHLQVKLLRVLQDHIIQPVGAERQSKVDVRVIAATSHDLELAIVNKRFRQDLYYRLSVVTLTLPALRQRPEDIPQLADAYREHFARHLKRPVSSLSREAIKILCAYPWPGNVRELANVMERAVLLCTGPIVGASDLAELSRRSQPTPERLEPDLANELAPGWYDKPWHEARQEALQVAELMYLRRLLSDTQGRMGEAAMRAGLNPRSLYEKMQQRGLDRSQFRPRRRGGANDVH